MSITSFMLKPRQVNLMLEGLMLGVLLTGLASWAVTDGVGRWLVTLHAIFGLGILLLAPAKTQGSVATGFRRGRGTRWLSAGFGVLVLVTVALGVAHSTGAWFGIGTWSALWTHTLLGFVLIPFLAWHVVSRPVRPKVADLDRRALLSGGAMVGVATAATLAQDRLVQLVGMSGDERRFTGSHEIASFAPGQMPSVIWLDDKRPSDTAADEWMLTVAGQQVSVESLWPASSPIVAALDCTGGWWSEQSWDAIPLSALLPEVRARSVNVGSQTGYSRLFAATDLDDIYLAVGYGGQPLRPGHGAPVRLVVPGRRGPWWIKWVVSIEPDDRPSFLQLPLPLT